MSPSNVKNGENIEENSSKLDAALIYAARGWRVFPCAPGGKKPLIKEWQKRATTDAQTIREWWRKWSSANVGIATGAASGLVALDIDPLHGGDASLTELLEQHGELPPTMRAATGGGGQHLLFAHPGGTVKNSISSLGEGLDIRGDGGYIIAPPSVHESGRSYEWLNAVRPAPLPEWLIKLLVGEKQTTVAADVQNSSQAKSSAASEGLIIEGARNNYLFRHVACPLRGQGASHKEIESFLLQVNAQRVSPPLSPEEIQKIARSAAKYPPNSAKVQSATNTGA